MNHLHRALVAFAFASFALLSSASSCNEPSVECTNDVDCGGGRVCSANQCVDCATNANCGAEEFCCQGVCRPSTEIDARCGCGLAPTGSPGQSCASVDANSLCVVGESAASVANVVQGTCGCGCTPEEGGPICGAPTEPGGAPVCSCDDNNANCRRASVDANGRPHRVADTCTPEDRCVCFSLGDATVCDPNGAQPDCTSTGGCAALATDPANCGVPGQNCLDDATGLAEGGACVEGGCLCNNITDCAGTNVDSCAFVAADQPSRCVCANFRAAGLQAACPMELECATGGCVLDGTAFATDEALRGALGLR